MDPLIWDLVLGILFIFSMSISIIGLMAFRYRGGIGPLILMISGIPGIVSSILGVLSQSGLMDLPVWVLILFFGISLVLIIISVIFWRHHK